MQNASSGLIRLRPFGPWRRLGVPGRPIARRRKQTIAKPAPGVKHVLNPQKAVGCRANARVANCGTRRAFGAAANVDIGASVASSATMIAKVFGSAPGNQKLCYFYL